jgi:hypothetical protein
MAFLSRSARMWTLLFALLQLTLPGMLSVVDAMRVETGRTAVAHVEDQSHGGCPAPHTDACDLCRYLSSAATGVRNATPVLDAAAVLSAPVATAEWAPRSAASLTRRSRAPPENVI